MKHKRERSWKSQILKTATRSSCALFLLLGVLRSAPCDGLLTSKGEAVVSQPSRSLPQDYKNAVSRSSSSPLFVSGFSPEEDVPRPKPRPVMEPPPVTETVMERISSPPKSIPPKIVVLGATGKIGRRVIRQLMALESDMTIVAFVRDYEKACDVLYDELIIEKTTKGPTLQVVVMDLVPPSFVAGYKPDEDEDDDGDDDDEAIISASRFYANDAADYDFRSSKEEDAIDLNPYLPLQDAISNATAVISTIGTIRSTLPFKDYILKPWRIFLSAGLWCRDGSHPYYVNYMVHKKVLEYCENAQRKRNREWRVYQNNQKRRASKVKGGTGDNNEEEDEKKVEKLRIVRISDHCLAHQAWHIVNVITNIFRSMVFKYQEKCEKLLSSSKLVDTIILRPGDLVDDIRNETTTTMSVDIDGKLPGPVYVGRDDVASLATLTAISALDPIVKKRQVHNANGTSVAKGARRARQRSKQKKAKLKPIHWNVAVGWTGENKNGYENADKCMEYIVKEQSRREKSIRRKKAVRNVSPIYRLLIQPWQKSIQRLRQRSVKPYGLFVLLPMLLFVYPTIISAIIRLCRQIPILHKAVLYIFSILQPTLQQISQPLKNNAGLSVKEMLQKSKTPQKIPEGILF